MTRDQNQKKKNQRKEETKTRKITSGWLEMLT